jgi:hypothetical protein
MSASATGTGSGNGDGDGNGEALFADVVPLVPAGLAPMLACEDSLNHLAAMQAPESCAGVAKPTEAEVRPPGARSCAAVSN